MSKSNDLTLKRIGFIFIIGLSVVAIIAALTMDGLFKLNLLVQAILPVILSPFVLVIGSMLTVFSFWILTITFLHTAGKVFESKFPSLALVFSLSAPIQDVIKNSPVRIFALLSAFILALCGWQVLIHSQLSADENWEIVTQDLPLLGDGSNLEETKVMFQPAYNIYTQVGTGPIDVHPVLVKDTTIEYVEGAEAKLITTTAYSNTPVERLFSVGGKDARGIARHVSHTLILPEQ